MTTIDGGALCTKTQEDCDRSKKLRWFGLNRKFKGSKWKQDVTESGFKFHMNNINATVGLEQMPYIEDIIQKHKDNCNFYNDNINNKKITIMSQTEKAESACWIYTILTPDRDHLQNFLSENGISSDVVHVRNDTYSVFDRFKVNPGDLKGCDEFCSQHLNIPVGWWLSKEDREKIVEVINRY